MKYVPAVESPYAMPTIELTRRNLEVLLAKLDDHASARTIMKDGYAITAVDVSDVEMEVQRIVHSADGDTDDLIAELTDSLTTLHSASLIGGGYVVKAVENAEHYAAENRQPGPMFMPASGETI